MSTLYTARDKFNLEILSNNKNCMGCGQLLLKHTKAYVMKYKSSKNKQITFTVVLCNLDECWQTWDWNVYEKLRLKRKN